MHPWQRLKQASSWKPMQVNHPLEMKVEAHSSWPGNSLKACPQEMENGQLNFLGLKCISQPTWFENAFFITAWIWVILPIVFWFVSFFQPDTPVGLIQHWRGAAFCVRSFHPLFFTAVFFTAHVYIIWSCQQVWLFSANQPVQGKRKKRFQLFS